MDINYIKKLASSNEGVDIEFKQTTGQLNRGMETLCGMLNGDGGFVIFGVCDDGKIVGQEVGDKTTRQIGEALGKFEPSVDIQPTYVDTDNPDKKLIAFHCSGVERGKPYMWDGKSYQRHDSVTTVMPREKFLRINENIAGLNYTWENEINENMTLSMLDEALIRNVAQGAVRRGRLTPLALDDSTSTLLQRFKVMNGTQLCNSAALLFGKDLFSYSNFKLRLARFRGTTRYEFIDNMQVEGNIFVMFDAAMSFFFKHLSLFGTTHNRMERKDELEVPYDALREATVNSLCHRAWQYIPSTIGIAIYDDRIEIENAGKFPAKLTPQQLTKEEDDNGIARTSLPPNPNIANVMYQAGLIENWGRGLTLMHRECERVGLPSPKFIDDDYIVKILFKRPQGMGNANRGDTEYIPQGQVGLSKESVGLSKESVGISKESVGISKDEEGISKDVEGISKDSVTNKKGILTDKNDTVEPENDTVGPENDTVGSENDTVGFSKESVGISKDSVGLSKESVGVSKESVVVSKESVGLSKGQTMRENRKYLNVIRVIGEEWFSATELCIMLNYKSKNSFTKNYLTPAVELGILRLQNPDSPNAPNQKYGLTDKGKSIYFSQK